MAEPLLHLKAEFSQAPCFFNGNPRFCLEQILVRAPLFQLPLKNVIAIGFRVVFSKVLEDGARDPFPLYIQRSLIHEPFFERGLVRLQRSNGEVANSRFRYIRIDGPAICHAAHNEEDRRPQPLPDQIEAPQRGPSPIPRELPKQITAGSH